MASVEPPAKQQRKRPQSVTANACMECKRRRSKCDGQHPCSACAGRDWRSCIYEVHQRTAAKIMRDRIGSLDARCNTQERILEAIANGGNSDAVVQQLKDGRTHASIARHMPDTTPQCLEESPISNDILSPGGPTGSMWGGGADETEAKYTTGTRYRPTSGHMSTAFDQDSEGSTGLAHYTSHYGRRPRSPVVKEEMTNEPLNIQACSISHTGSDIPSASAGRIVHDYTDLAEPWTTVTADDSLIRHLISLYFCWQYPGFASLSRVHFQHDFDAGRRRFCSSLLVNAMLSIGCLYSDMPEARQDSNDDAHAGDQFFEEAKRLLANRSDCSLPTIQALQLMSLLESSRGQDSSSWSYASQAMRLSVESGLHLEISDPGQTGKEREVRSATFWGCFTLDQTWSLLIGRTPHMSRQDIHVDAPLVIAEHEAEGWIPYTDEGFSHDTSRWSPRDSGLVFKCLCDLSLISSDMLHLLHAPDTPFSGQLIFDAHTKYLRWYENLLSPLRLGQNFTPSALFIHMYYHSAILLLFRPLLDHPDPTSHFPYSPHEICTEAVSNITTLMHAYRNLFTLRRTPVFLPQILLNGSIAQLMQKYDITDGPIQDKMDDLREMGMGHWVAEKSAEIVRLLSCRGEKLWEGNVEKNGAAGGGQVVELGRQDSAYEEDLDLIDNVEYDAKHNMHTQTNANNDNNNNGTSLSQGLNVIQEDGIVHQSLAPGAILGPAP